jgi:hypothetical protein
LRRSHSCCLTSGNGPLGLREFFPEVKDVLGRLGDSEFDDRLGWNLDLLHRLGVDARPRFPLLFHQFTKAEQDEFAVLFDLLVGQGTGCIEKMLPPFSCLSEWLGRVQLEVLSWSSFSRLIAAVLIDFK